MFNTPSTTRRHALKLLAAGLLTRPRIVSGQVAVPFTKPASPAEALKMLTEGNERYLAHALTSFQADLAILRSDSEEHQEPFAAVLACADSRVPPEIVFDQSLGHLFVVRVAGNIASPATIASLEYAATVLAVQAILVLGHTNCGAVKAASAVKSVPGQISTLYPAIHPAIAGARGDLTEASRRNAMLQASILREASPPLVQLVADGKLAVTSALYDVGTGKVTSLPN